MVRRYTKIVLRRWRDSSHCRQGKHQFDQVLLGPDKNRFVSTPLTVSCPLAIFSQVLAPLQTPTRPDHCCINIPPLSAHRNKQS
ncbi:hypothetical protein RRG08_021585 [Elysia crispata]|uniref:Uncharacterized protein n=1 Tax=Elysia crispata TaxID=231223 RepID=A0AAE0XDN7_9GAST|nr:hypothetical protein RRG08_021585 [Elysia crispata]